jgi:hypothetical protein
MRNGKKRKLFRMFSLLFASFFTITKQSETNKIHFRLRFACNKSPLFASLFSFAIFATKFEPFSLFSLLSTFFRYFLNYFFRYFRFNILTSPPFFASIANSSHHLVTNFYNYVGKLHIRYGSLCTLTDFYFANYHKCTQIITNESN